jgi:phosphate-selective porin OprO/OprP
MEEANRRLAEQVETLARGYESLLRKVEAPDPPEAPGPPTPAPALPIAVDPPDPLVPSSAPAPASPAARPKRPTALNAEFGNGFRFGTEDEEYTLEVHQETQVDYRLFVPPGEEYANSGFVFPRVRLLLNGQLTKPIEYMFSINRGFGNLDILDAWVNFRYDERFQLRVGRFMSPFNYEQYLIRNMWLITPERSLFTSNLGLNRMIGATLWGELADDRVNYALGLFNGPRNSFEDFNESKDVMAFLNLRPWGNRDGSALQNLDLGGSFVYGAQDNPLVPRSFRTASNASNAGTADLVAAPFFIFNPDVVERGQRAFWSGHLAYFRGPLSLVADYNGAILRYAASRSAAESVVIPTHGYAVSLGYFLTGEQVKRREAVAPLRPFDLRPGKRGPGAVELVARFTALDFDRDILGNGLSDPTLWSNRAWSTNVGFNWYLNRYLKVYLDWQHSEFGDPVYYAPPDRKQIANELFWFRLQLFY